MPFEDSFDASQVEPSQGFDVHPAGIFDASIMNTSIEPTKDQSGGLFKVDFGTPAGKITKRYNLWNPSPQAVEIARKELSALCYATGIFKLDFRNDAAVLRNARCKIEVAHQIDKDTKQPSKYMEVKRVLDVNGNEPGKGPSPAPQPVPQGQPLQQQPSGSWGTQQPANAPAPNPAPQKPPWG